MRYIYLCRTCAKSAVDPDTALFETAHRMFPTPEELRAALVCPTCGGFDVVRHYGQDNPTLLVRGVNWHEYHSQNEAAMRRERDRYLLQTGGDPYAAHRQPGETDKLLDDLTRAGEEQPQRKHFIPKR
jgi:hypothetical protein